MKTTKSKMSVEIQAAFQCLNCQNQITTMSYKLVVPDVCGNCSSVDFKTLWKQKIRIDTTVSSLD